MTTPTAETLAQPADGTAASSADSSQAKRSPIGALFTAVAVIEALTWAGLLVGMFLKYVTGTTEMGVWLFGRLHGGAFMLYVAMTIVAAISLLALLAAIPPLVTVPLEIWLHRTGRLNRR